MPGPWNRLTIGFAALAAVATFGFGWLLLRPEAPRPVTRVSVDIPEDQFFSPVRGDFDLSSDGSVMVYRGVSDVGQAQLWARRWNALDATPMRDTNGAQRPAISPNGQEVAFTVAGSVIHVAPLRGGVSRTLTDSASSTGGLPRWSPDGAWIYFSDASGGLSRLPSGGGAPEIVTVVDTAAGDSDHVWFDVLPGGSAVYTVAGAGKAARIQALDVETGEIRDLTEGRYPRYSNTGHLLFQDATQTTLLVAPFDVERLELTGAPLTLADGLLPVGNSQFGLNPGSFAVSQTGRIIYRVGSSAGNVTSPVWVERDGTAREINPGWSMTGQSNLSSLVLSPNGDRLTISNPDSEGAVDLWVKQLPTGPLSRLTFEGTLNYRATWSPNGQSLTFISNRAGANDLWTKRADGSGTAELVLDREAPIFQALYSSDGTWLVFREGGGPASALYAMRVADSEVVPLVVTEFQENRVALSPNDRWLAYVSNSTGRFEVYVRPFPPDAGSGLVQVSTNGGTEPLWAHNGRELFYRNGDNELVVVEFTEDPTFATVREAVLFPMDDYLAGGPIQMYNVSPDDQSLVMLRITDQASGATELIMVENWTEELRQRMGN